MCAKRKSVLRRSQAERDVNERANELACALADYPLSAQINGVLLDHHHHFVWTLAMLVYFVECAKCVTCVDTSLFDRFHWLRHSSAVGFLLAIVANFFFSFFFLLFFSECKLPFQWAAFETFIHFFSRFALFVWNHQTISKSIIKHLYASFMCINNDLVATTSRKLL